MQLYRVRKQRLTGEHAQLTQGRLETVQMGSRRRLVDDPLLPDLDDHGRDPDLGGGAGRGSGHVIAGGGDQVSESVGPSQPVGAAVEVRVTGHPVHGERLECLDQIATVEVEVRVGTADHVLEQEVHHPRRGRAVESTGECAVQVPAVPRIHIDAALEEPRQVDQRDHHHGSAELARIERPGEADGCLDRRVFRRVDPGRDDQRWAVLRPTDNPGGHLPRRFDAGDPDHPPDALPCRGPQIAQRSALCQCHPCNSSREPETPKTSTGHRCGRPARFSSRPFRPARGHPPRSLRARAAHLPPRTTLADGASSGCSTERRMPARRRRSGASAETRPWASGADPVMVAMLPQRSRARVAPPSCPGGRPGEPASSDRPGRRRGGHQQSRRCKAIGHRFRSSMQTRSIAEASMRRGWASWPGSRRPDSMNIMRRRQNNVRGKASCGRRRVIEAGEQETRTVRGRLRSLSGPISSSDSWLGQRPPMSGG